MTGGHLLVIVRSRTQARICLDDIPLVGYLHE
jgi:hypothetical protein